jgi:hypothetical protein
MEIAVEEFDLGYSATVGSALLQQLNADAFGNEFTGLETWSAAGSGDTRRSALARHDGRPCHLHGAPCRWSGPRTEAALATPVPMHGLNADVR